MRRRRAGRVVGLLSLVLAATAVAEPATVDPDELDAMLTDLEASGGFLTAAELAMLLPPEPVRTRGSWAVGLGARDGAGPRVGARAEIVAPRWSGRISARRDDRGDAVIGWLAASRSAWTLQAGGGAPCLGQGLLAAPAGARASLSTEASLTATRQGWRPSASLDSERRLLGMVGSWRTGHVTLGAGSARDRDGRRVLHGSAGAAVGPSRVGVLGLQWDRCRGLAADLVWSRLAWRLAVEAAGWRHHDGAALERAWLLGADWRGEHWQAEVQVANSRAASGPPGGVRPASLTGWHGGGWALRLIARPAAGWSAALALGDGDDRDPGAARAGRRRRSLVGLRVSGGDSRGTVWEFRLRRSDEKRWTWDPLEPWRPAALGSHRLRTWLAATVEIPAGAGRAGLAWQGLEEAGDRRQLITARWERRGGGVTWRGALQSAWGEPLDLVAVSAPVPALVRLRHWGHWQRSAWFGVQGRGRWRWQFGVEARQPTVGEGSGPVLEVQTELGWSY